VPNYCKILIFGFQTPTCISDCITKYSCPFYPVPEHCSCIAYKHPETAVVIWDTIKVINKCVQASTLYVLYVQRLTVKFVRIVCTEVNGEVCTYCMYRG